MQSMSKVYISRSTVFWLIEFIDYTCYRLIDNTVSNNIDKTVDKRGYL